jgi:hypothetical protein
VVVALPDLAVEPGVMALPLPLLDGATDLVDDLTGLSALRPDEAGAAVLGVSVGGRKMLKSSGSGEWCRGGMSGDFRLLFSGTGGEPLAALLDGTTTSTV